MQHHPLHVLEEDEQPAETEIPMHSESRREAARGCLLIAKLPLIIVIVLSMVLVGLARMRVSFDHHKESESTLVDSGRIELTPDALVSQFLFGSGGAPSSQWVLGPDDKNCDEACGTVGLSCTVEGLRAHQADVDSCPKMSTLVSSLGGTCHTKDGDWPNQPEVPAMVGGWYCYCSGPSKPSYSFSCAARSGHKKTRRLCWCETTTPAPAPKSQASMASRVFAGICNKGQKQWLGAHDSASACMDSIKARPDCSHEYFLYAAPDLGGDSNCGCIDLSTDCSPGSRQHFWGGRCGLYQIVAACSGSEGFSKGSTDYRGCQDKTKSGKTCQKWTSQSPHAHGFAPSEFPDAGLGDHNYCRNPDDESTIWCYTTDTGKRREYCSPKATTSAPAPAPPTPAPTPEPTPAPLVSQWVLGKGGSSCDDACAPLGLICSAEGLHTQNHEVNNCEKVSAVIKSLGGNCGGKDPNWPNQPEVPTLVGGWYCYCGGPNKQKHQFHCGWKSQKDAQRLCWCHASTATPAPDVVTPVPPKTTPTPTPASDPTTGWILGAAGQSCDDACGAHSLQCYPGYLWAHNGDVDNCDKVSALISKLGGKCGGTDPNWPLQPANPSLVKGWYCYCGGPGKQAHQFSCDWKPQANAQRLCWCRKPLTQTIAWTRQEAAAVKTNIYKAFDDSIGHWKIATSLMGTVLRLSFHDCVRYQDGSGGCDGCLNWHGVDDNLQDMCKKDAGAHQCGLPEPTDKFNNGLGGAVYMLEGIYTSPLSLELPYSLKDAGKSRADLWALAGILAVEYTMEFNNNVCETGTLPSDSWKGQCLLAQGKPDCKVSPSRPLRFKYGRKDCEPCANCYPYQTDKVEIHPRVKFNGSQVAKFMEEEFGFDGKETVAIMGAHTIGVFHEFKTGLKYVWTPRSEFSFNNEYYKNMVGEPGPFFEDEYCTRIGAAWGEMSDLRWVWKANHMWSDTRGEIQWIGMRHTCPNCDHTYKSAAIPWITEIAEDCCKKDVPAGAYCRPDNNRQKGSNPVASDYPKNDVKGPRVIGMGTGGCEVYKFIWSHDHAMLNSDMGLLLNFTVDEDGYPGSCPAETAWGAPLHHFDKDHALSGAPAGYQECPISKFAGSDGTPMSQWVQEFAKDQTKWINEYIPAMEKYLQNGYAADALTPLVRD